MNIIITGASRGIGRALTETFDTPENSLALISKSGSLGYIPTKANFLNISTDLADISGLSLIFADISSKLNGIDILINNAGVGIFKDFTEFSDDEFQNQLSANINHVFKFSLLAIKEFKEKKRGIILNINSVSSIKTFSYSSIYAASKAAMLAMSRSIREETRAYGIKVIDVILGATNTDIWDGETRANLPHRLMEPKDVASAIKSVIELSLTKNIYIEEITIRPQLGDL